jgi:hypothetical protein
MRKIESLYRTNIRFIFGGVSVPLIERTARVSIAEVRTGVAHAEIEAGGDGGSP